MFLLKIVKLCTLLSNFDITSNNMFYAVQFSAQV